MANILTVNSGSSGSALVRGGQSNAWTLDSWNPNTASIPNLSASSITNTSFTMPDFTAGTSYPAYGNKVLTAGDGTNTATFNVVFSPKATRSYVTLTSVGVGVGYIGNYVVCNVGDQITFDLPSYLAVTNHSVSVTGLIQTDYLGTFTVYHRRVSDGVVTILDINTNAGTVIVIDVTNFTANNTSPRFDAAWVAGNRP